MNIALMAHDNKKELMVQFCTAYAGVLSRHTLCATSVTGKMVSEASGLPIHLFMARIHGGAEQIGARIAYNEIDMVLYFCDPNSPQYNDNLTYITKLCDQNNIPFATNLATAEMLIMGLPARRSRLARYRQPQDQALHHLSKNPGDFKIRFVIFIL